MFARAYQDQDGARAEQLAHLNREELGSAGQGTKGRPICNASARPFGKTARLLARRAGIHIDLHTDGDFKDFRCLPGHVLPPSGCDRSLVG